MEPDSMRISRLLMAKTASISGLESDLFTTRMYHETFMTKYVKTHNTILCSYAHCWQPRTFKSCN
jgi:hypothetical protein